MINIKSTKLIELEHLITEIELNYEIDPGETAGFIPSFPNRAVETREIERRQRSEPGRMQAL